MKQSPYLNKVQESMKPGVITLHGFLGSDSRNLIDILIEDDAAVKRKNLTHDLIAARMIEFRDSGAAGLGEFRRVPPHFEVKVDSVRGKLPCPFGEPGIHQKTNITVRNTVLDREITYTDMHIHLVQMHGFYEGTGSPYRLNPGILMEVLEIESAENP
ncbi:MAG: hypothetical protein E4H36_14005 [Spirochaetales bacterium]|nr:MAG: hypothetical protein E4H36_14005 [Spirochaetales bacterium]